VPHPLWDAELAAAEVRRNAARGCRAVAFSELPNKLKLPSIHDRDRYWDPFFAACSETGTVICMHIGSASSFLTTSRDAPQGVSIALTTVNSQMEMADWLMSGALARFPGIKLAFSESQIGWMPFLFDRCDTIWRKSNAAEIDPSITEPPSSYVKGRVYGCFFEDDFGLRVRDEIGIDQITFERDYPHRDSTWPNTKAHAQKAMADLSAEEIHKVVRGSALVLLQLPETVPAR
jgi:predicted TIM-barrel fold metal-dependent hydrolase